MSLIFFFEKFNLISCEICVPIVAHGNDTLISKSNIPIAQKTQENIMSIIITRSM